ncbi:MAG: efflux RND transporter periplasmic adaptor subunit [Wenzhouxiangellaceae bacterium]
MNRIVRMTRPGALLLVLALSSGTTALLAQTAQQAHDEAAEAADASTDHDAQGHEHGQTDRPEAGGEREIAYWVAPMDPSYRRDRPGKSPMGMELVPVYADELPAPGTVRVSASVQQQINLRTAPVREGRLWRRIDTVGRVQWAADRLRHVHTRVSGWIGEVGVAAVGDEVTAGALLYTLYSPELSNAQDELIRARARGGELLQAARDRLHTLGVQRAVIERIEQSGRALEYVPWYAEHGGVVTRLNARDRMRVSPETELFELAADDLLWVIADVAGRQTDWLAVGQSVEVRTDYRPGRLWESTISHLYPELDPVTLTRQVRIEVPGIADGLSPGMWTRVRIYAGPVDGQIFIPREALIRTGRDERVIVRTADESFEVRPVVSGMESGPYVAILAGLKPGEQVVTSGQFLIDSEASIHAEGTRLQGGGHGHQH